MRSVKIVKWLLFILMIAITVAFFSSCKQPKVITEKQSFYKETFRDSIIQLPGETITQPLSDSFLNMLKRQFKSDLKDTIKIPSKNGNAELQFYLDQFGQLQAACEAKDREIDALIKIIEKFEAQNNNVIFTEYRMAWWGWLIVAVNFGLLFNLIRFKIFRRK